VKHTHLTQAAVQHICGVLTSDTLTAPIAVPANTATGFYHCKTCTAMQSSSARSFDRH